MKHYIVFGGSGGIGQALASTLRREDRQVWIVARGSERLSAVAEEISATPLTADVLNPASIDQVFEKVAHSGGDIQGIAVCVGSILLKPAHLTSDAEWSETLAINLTAPFNVLRAAVKNHSSRSYSSMLSFLMFSSAAARIGLANHEAIAAAKAGVIGLTLSAASSYASKGIRVNCIAPGLVETALSSRILANEGAKQASLGLHPLRRFGNASEIAALAAFLLGEESSWITAEVFGADGGLAKIKQRS